MPTRTDIDELAQRLSHPDASVRRIAAMDLAKSGDEGLRALVRHLPQETDEKAAVLMIQRLGEAELGAAMPALVELRDNRATPIRTFHAAVLAHDRIERAAGPGRA